MDVIIPQNRRREKRKLRKLARLLSLPRHHPEGEDVPHFPEADFWLGMTVTVIPQGGVYHSEIVARLGGPLRRSENPAGQFACQRPSLSYCHDCGSCPPSRLRSSVDNFWTPCIEFS
jgi:hypothetical protein